MPTYSYLCNQCGVKFEKEVPFSANAESQTCPAGHLQVRRVFTAPAVVFKGKGFYVTDSRAAHKGNSGG